MQPLSNLPPVVKNLLIINIICFLPFILIDHMNPAGRYSTLFAVYYFDSPDFRIWQIITYMFMHGGWLHIIFNMFVLYQFGPIVEYSLGSKKFLNFYFICGLGAIALQMFVQAMQVHAITGSFTIANPNLEASYLQYGPYAQKLYDIYHASMVGASGAIEGVMVGFAMLYPNLELMIMFIPVPVKAKYIIPGYLLFEIYLSINQNPGDNVAHLAHIGGAIFGFIMIKAWRIKSN
jgi:membrane associated rhomboid family serine protease